jgi:hypothetical protein
LFFFRNLESRIGAGLVDLCFVANEPIRCCYRNDEKVRGVRTNVQTSSTKENPGSSNEQDSISPDVTASQRREQRHLELEFFLNPDFADY